MRRYAIVLGAVAGAVALGALTLWSLAEVRANDYMMVGVIVAEENVALQIAERQDVTGGVVVDEVLAPDDSWIVVHLDDDGAPGMRVGTAPVSQGVSRDVVVELDDGAMLTDELIVALHADRGSRGEFEFAMDAFHRSPDKPYFVGFEEVARRVSIR